MIKYLMSNRLWIIICRNTMYPELPNYVVLTYSGLSKKESVQMCREKGFEPMSAIFRFRRGELKRFNYHSMVKAESTALIKF